MDVVVNSNLEAIPEGAKPLTSSGCFYEHFLSCLGYDPACLPLADLLRVGHQLDGAWAIMSLIHWEATHNDAMIVADMQGLELTDNESRNWFNEIAAFLKPDNMTMIYHDLYTWLVKIDNKSSLSTKTLNAMLHQSIMPVLAQMDDTLFWQKLITELQMYLSIHPLNQARTNLLPVNGVWFWGNTFLKKQTDRRIITDDMFLLSDSFAPFFHIQSLNSATVLQKDDLLLINDSSLIKKYNLQDTLAKYSVRWYWNNQAYLAGAISWWSRMWR